MKSITLLFVAVLFASCAKETNTIQSGSYKLYNDTDQLTTMVVSSDSIWFYHGVALVGATVNHGLESPVFIPANIWGSNPEIMGEFQRIGYFVEIVYRTDQEYQMDWVKE